MFQLRFNLIEPPCAVMRLEKTALLKTKGESNLRRAALSAQPRPERERMSVACRHHKACILNKNMDDANFALSS